MENTDRRLTALHPALNAGWDNAAGIWTPLNGWQKAGTSTYYHQTEIDLSGFSRESLTFFPNAVGIQDPGVYLFRPQVILPEFEQQALQVLDIITSVPLRGAAGVLEVADSQRPFGGLPAANTGMGLLGSDYDFTPILFGMYRFFTANSNIPYPGYVQLERSQRFDSGEPTAVDRLYCYRIVSHFQQDLIDGDSLSVPACRQLVSGVMSQESELVYMQRLKRGYELANQE